MDIDRNRAKNMIKMGFKIVLCVVMMLCISCIDKDNINKNGIDFNNSAFLCIKEDINANKTIRQGFISEKSDTIRVLRNGVNAAIVTLSEPVIVAQAENKEIWGYFQFPVLYKADNEIIVVGWSMRADSYTAYGDKSAGYRMSKDSGRTWEVLDGDYFMRGRGEIVLKNGDVLQQENPASKDINDYTNFPEPVNKEPIAGYNFYLESELPSDLQGVYFNYWHMQTGKKEFIHSSLIDPNLLRCTINGYMPIVWWGEIKNEKDGTLVAGVYGGLYQNTEGDVLRTGISFYRSNDIGKSWSLIGKIPYQPGGKLYLFDGNDGFTEPSFEILKNGTYLCVMRTSSSTPMYKSFSEDKGEHWTEPEAFTPNGVKPFLFQLGNGVLVLTSGRPGVQIRFCLDGDGKIWTEPIEMMPFIDEDGNYDLWGITCGYTSVLKVDDNTFYLVYSNFKNKNNNGEDRKTIMFRKVQVFLKD